MIKKVILDTDIGNDCDDAGALAMLCGYACRGKCEILGVACCTAKPYAPSCVRAIAEDYRLTFPVGRLTDGFDGVQDYYCGLFKEKQACSEEYIRFYRKIFVDNRDIILICIGPLHGMNLLLDSCADDISPLTGTELFKESVSRIYAMCGRFDGETEWNISMDILSARSFFLRCPVPVEVCPFEEGFGVMTGRNLREGSAAKKIYASFCKDKRGVRDSWDPLTVYAAVEGKKCRGERCRLTVDEKGKMTREEGRGHCVIKAQRDIAKILDKRMV